MHNKPNIIISLDIEATGDSPLTSSMVMLGAAAILDNGPIKIENKDTWLISTLQLCIKEVLPPGERCWNEFWLNNMKVWNHIKKHEKDPTECMNLFDEWLCNLQQKYNITNFVYNPSAYDHMWISCYYDKYCTTKKYKIPYSGICITSMLKTTYHLNKTSEINRAINCTDLVHDHFADADSLQQGYKYINLKYWIRKHTCYKL